MYITLINITSAFL